LEVEEAFLALEGKGPEDLMSVTFALAVEMLVLAGLATDADHALSQVQAALDSGRALETLGRVIEAQGGNPAILSDPGVLPQAKAVEIYEAPGRGYVTQVDPRQIGEAIVEMGGGRQRLDDSIDHSVGFVITVKPGQHVAAGEPIASVFARDEAGIALGLRALEEAIVIGEQAPVLPLIGERVTFTPQP
jgi:pyrimidine-nucleoside phosphorylase